MTTELEQEFGHLILHDPVAYPSLGKVYVHIDGAPLDPADLTLMDQSGWRALSQGQGWTQSFMDRLSQLVYDWLSGSDRRELLSLARTPGSDEEDFRPAELFRKWLDRERLGRLNALTADFDEIRPLAHYYAMSHALRAVLSAVGHTDSWRSTSRTNAMAEKRLGVALVGSEVGRQPASRDHAPTVLGSPNRGPRPVNPWRPHRH